LAYVDISKEKREVEIRNILLLLTLRLKKQTKSNPGKTFNLFQLKKKNEVQLFAKNYSFHKNKQKIVSPVAL